MMRTPTPKGYQQMFGDIHAKDFSSRPLAHNISLQQEGPLPIQIYKGSGSKTKGV